MDPAPLSITLFGSFAVSVGGQPLRPLRSRPAEWLLALLVLRHGRVLSRAALAHTLWPESRHEQALLNLRRALLELRQALGPAAARLAAPTRDSLRLDLTAAAVDLLRFDAAVAAGEEGALQEAVSLYQGPLLEGCSEEWILGEREARHEACLQALERLADLALARGEAPAALGYLQRAETLEPLRDSVQQRRMQALAASGDLPAALLSYREYRLRLHREMNLEPDPETTRLFHELQSGRRGSGRSFPPRQDPAPAPAGASGPALLVHPGDQSMPHPLPEARPSAPPPRPLTTLIGREAAVEAVTGLVSSSRLVTLVGGGGVGKTRLALQVATGLEPRYPGRVLFVELAPLADPALLPAFVAAAVGLHEAGEAPGAGSLVQTLTEWLPPQPTLLVLDNCEHLIQAVAELAQRLLAACPELHLMATSRQRLGVTGEVAWRVPSLSAPDPELLPGDETGAVAHVQQFPAVQLFLERAAAVRPGFQLRDREDALALARICQRLDGIPLALELAAARVPVLPIPQIAARLDDRFRLLTGGSRAAIPRHQTLRALIDWSYDSLPAEEAALFRRLSVFAGGWTLEAAEALCSESGEANAKCGVRNPEFELDSHPSVLRTPYSAVRTEEVLDLLTVLMDRSLVLVEEASEGLRYRMLETVREYAREKLQQCGEEEAARAGHLAYFLRLAEEAGTNLRGPNPEAALAQLDAEIDNFRAALAWCQEGADSEGDGAAAALRLVGASWWLWHPQGRLAEGLYWLAGALERGYQLPPAARAPALFRAAHLWTARGDRDRARSFFQAARREYEAFLAVVRREGNPVAVAEVLLTLSEVAFALDDLDAAGEFCVQARQIFEERQEPAGVARSLEWMAGVASRRQDRQTARALLEERVAICRKVGVPDLLIHALGALGHLEREEGHHGRAGTLYRESLRLRQEAGALFALAQSLEDLAVLAGREQQFDRAARLLGASEVFCETLGARPPVAIVPEYERTVAESRAALGAAAFAAAWAEGRAMSLDQAVEYASEGKEPTGGEGEALEIEETPVGTASDRHVAPSPSPPPAPSRLPRPLTALVGREEELQEVMRLVGSCRLVTLIGGGGVGKTRLALEIAAGLETQYPGRVLFVDLTPLADPALLPAFVAAALGLHEAEEARVDAAGVSAGGRAPGRPEASLVTHTLTNWLAQGPTLLVLDNCEHLIQAVAELAQSLLAACPALHLLATSRQRLGVTGEVAWRVPSLSAPDPEALPQDARGAVAYVHQFPAVQLFLERAAAVRPGLQLREREEALALARICRRLDGIPLALELAAARVSVLPIPQIAARLDDRFRLLTGGSRAALPRHQTLRALIDWSYDQLPAAEARLLRQLAVFAGGWTLASAEAVCADFGLGSDPSAIQNPNAQRAPEIQNAEVLDLLDALVDRSLVLAEESGGDLRYRMLETVREYALEKLREQGEEEAARAAHLACFLRLAEELGPDLRGPRPEAALTQLEAERDNLRAALRFCAEGEAFSLLPSTLHAPRAALSACEAELRLGAALWPFWETRGYFSEGRHHLRAALQRPGLPDAAERAQALLGAARLAIHQGDLDEADTFAQESRERFRSLGDTRGMAAALLCLGEVAASRGQIAAAASLFAEGLEASRQSGWTQGSAMTLVRLGGVAMIQGEHARARSSLEEGRALAEALGDALTLAIALYELGNLATREGDDARAGPLLEQSLAIWRRRELAYAPAHALTVLGHLAERQGDRTRATSYLEQAAATYRELGNRVNLVWALLDLGSVHFRGAAYASARAVYEESLGMARELANPYAIAAASNNLGMLCFLLGDAVRAQVLHREALALYQSCGSAEGVVWALERLGVVTAKHGDPQRAARLLGAASAARAEFAKESTAWESSDLKEAAAAVREKLGPEAWETGWEAGRAMAREEAIAFALDDAGT